MPVFFARLAFVLRNWTFLLLLPVGVVLGAAFLGPLFSLRPIETTRVSATRDVFNREVLTAVLVVYAACLVFGPR
jgi:hypothetical protein